MSDVEILKQRLHGLSSDATRAAGSLSGFKSGFGKNVAQVESLIGGTSTGDDKKIQELLDSAGEAVEQAIRELKVAAEGCGKYADKL